MVHNVRTSAADEERFCRYSMSSFSSADVRSIDSVRLTSTTLSLSTPNSVVANLPTYFLRFKPRFNVARRALFALFIVI